MIPLPAQRYWEEPYHTGSKVQNCSIYERIIRKEKFDKSQLNVNGYIYAESNVYTKRLSSSKFSQEMFTLNALLLRTEVYPWIGQSQIKHFQLRISTP